MVHCGSIVTTILLLTSSNVIDIFNLYYKIALSRVAVAVTPQPRHWSITVNSDRSRHSGHTTAEWGKRGRMAVACAASSQTDGIRNEGILAITPCNGVMACIPSFVTRSSISPLYCRAEMYTGCVACCPLVSYGEYAGRTDGRQTVYAFC